MNDNDFKEILVVDDEPMIAEEICELFTDYGYCCYHCNDTDSAYQIFSQNNISIVLTDLHMPEKNGLTLIKELLQLSKQSLRPLKTILFTGQAEKEDVIKALKIGVSDYYSKPLNIDELLLGVNSLRKELIKEKDTATIDNIEQKLQQLSDAMNNLRGDVTQLKTKNEISSVNLNEPSPHTETVSSTELLLSELSPRQQAVARLIGEGMTNYQIAVELGLSENTVKLYVSQILRQTKMHNRTQLALALSKD